MAGNPPFPGTRPAADDDDNTPGRRNTTVSIRTAGPRSSSYSVAAV